MNKFLVTTLSLSIILTGCASSTAVSNNQEETKSNTETTDREITTSDVKSSTSKEAKSTEEFIWPTDGELQASIDSYEGHSGIDIESGKGADVVASKAGTVLEAGWDELGKGYYVLLDNGDGYQTLYGQLEENLAVSVGDEVEQGQIIGHEGDTGNVTKEHLHFEITKDGEVIDPETVLPTK